MGSRSRVARSTLADANESRDWRVELFFKWIKQHLRLKAFYETSANAAKTEVWIAISVYGRVAILKKAALLRPQSPHSFADSELVAIRENASFTSTYQSRHRKLGERPRYPVESAQLITGEQGTEVMITMNASDPGYFHRLSEQSPPGFGINNATFSEGKAALAAGAVCATTNPTYLSRLLTQEPDCVADLIDEASKETNDDDRIAGLVYRKAVARRLKLFLPLYEQTQGQRRFVAIQGDPRANTDPDAILRKCNSFASTLRME